MSRTLKKLLAAAAVAGSLAAITPPAQASPPQCQYYIVFNMQFRLCRPV